MEALKKSECEIKDNFDLTAYSSAKLPMYARYVAYPDNEEKLVNLLSLLCEIQIPYKLMGGMTNLLVKNGMYDGVVIKTDKLQRKRLAENRITLFCGVRMASVIRSMARLGLGGMDGLAGIPGSVGGMVRQNAGAYGYEISDRFVSADCYLTKDKKVVTLSKDCMQFEYRNSVLTDNSTVLVSATFELIPSSPQLLLERISDFGKKRRASQPIEYPSLGSTFKRYNGQSAGFYIDRAGLKGARVGAAEVSEKHAGFIINKGGATADDFLKLIDIVKGRVYSYFGIELEEEIEII